MIDDVLSTARRNANDARRLVTFIESPEFMELFKAATLVEQTTIHQWVKEHKYDRVYSWYKRAAVVQVRLYHLTVRELRKLAVRYKIPDYQYLRQWELIDELERHLRSAVEGNAHTDGGPV